MEKVIQNSDSIYYRFGFDYFGPFLYGFTRWLKKNIDANAYNKVFFFSRDGFMMAKAFEIMDEGKTNAEYVYFSRKSIRQTLLWETDSFGESLQYLGWERFVSVGKILEYYGFDEIERDNIIKENHLDENRDINFDEICNDQEIKAFYTSYHDQIHSKSKQQAELLKRYIEQIGMEGKCAIIDIGWHGSMQYYLDLFCKNNKINCVLDGYYVGILPDFSLKSKTYGYAYSESNPKNRKKMLCFFGGYERLFQGFNGSTIGYSLTQDDYVMPQLAEYEYNNAEDQNLIKRIEDWQRGALDYVKCNINSNLKDEELLKPLIDFGTKPTRKDTKIFEGFYTKDGSKRYFTCHRRLISYKPKDFIHDLSNSQWKTGFLKSAFKIPFPYFRIYEVLRK